MCAVYLTLSFVIDRSHSKPQRMEVRNMNTNLVGNLMISSYLHERQD
jgi:hypothetical protein